MRTNHLIIVLSTLLLFNTCQQNQHSSSIVEATDPVKEALTADLQAIYNGGLINGFATTIVSEEKILYANGFGYADLAAQKPYSRSTVQNIASISKTLIGIALVKAQEDGKLLLDDPISKYLDFEVVNPNYPDRAITIRQLTTHTSSITDGDIYDAKSYILEAEVDTSEADIKVRDYFSPPSDRVAMDVFLKNCLDQKGAWYTGEVYLAEKAPGEYFEYTNIGATLAAHVLEKATGEKYSDYTRKHILEPLGMQASGWSYDEIDPAQHTILYADSVARIPAYSLVTYPDGGLITSIDDFAKYLQELIRGYAGNGTLLSPEAYRKFYATQLSDDNFEDRDAESVYNDEYDFGVFIGFSAKGYIGHTGGDPGVSTFMFFDEAKKIGSMMMINTDIYNEKGYQQFLSIWKKLEEYQDQLK